MERQLTYHLAEDDGSILIDFDNDADARYQFQVRPKDYDTGDGIILSVNTRACIALARLFAQLAATGTTLLYSTYLGGVEWRVELQE